MSDPAVPANTAAPATTAVPPPDTGPNTPAPAPPPAKPPAPKPAESKAEPAKPAKPVLPAPEDVPPNAVDKDGLPVCTTANSVVTPSGEIKRIPGQHIHSWQHTFRVCADIRYPETDKLQSLTRRTPAMPCCEDSAQAAAVLFASMRNGMTLVVYDASETGDDVRYGLVWNDDLTVLDPHPKDAAATDKARAEGKEQGLTLVGLTDGKLALAKHVSPMQVTECKPS